MPEMKPRKQFEKETGVKAIITQGWVYSSSYRFKVVGREAVISDLTGGREYSILYRQEYVKWLEQENSRLRQLKEDLCQTK